MKILLISLMILSSTTVFARQEVSPSFENRWERRLAAEQNKTPVEEKTTPSQPQNTQHDDANKPKCC